MIEPRSKLLRLRLDKMIPELNFYYARLDDETVRQVDTSECELELDKLEREFYQNLKQLVAIGEDVPNIYFAHCHKASMIVDNLGRMQYTL